MAELENLEPERLLQEAIYFRSLLLASEKRERAAEQRELALKQDIATTKSLLNYYKTQAPAATVPKVQKGHNGAIYHYNGSNKGASGER